MKRVIIDDYCLSLKQEVFLDDLHTGLNKDVRVIITGNVTITELRIKEEDINQFITFRCDHIDREKYIIIIK